MQKGYLGSVQVDVGCALIGTDGQPVTQPVKGLTFRVVQSVPVRTSAYQVATGGSDAAFQSFRQP